MIHSLDNQTTRTEKLENLNVHFKYFKLCKVENIKKKKRTAVKSLGVSCGVQRRIFIVCKIKSLRM